MKKHFKANKSRSNLQTVQLNNAHNERISDLGSQVWQARRNNLRNIFEQNCNQFQTHMHCHRHSTLPAGGNTRWKQMKRSKVNARPVDNSHAYIGPNERHPYNRGTFTDFHNWSSSRCAQFHRCHCQHRNDKRRHVCNGRPHHLNLSDPMFGQGLGVYMQQELTSLAREFIQQGEPCTPHPQPRRPDIIIPPDKFAMSAEY